jgi:hypothetical protein
VVIQSRATPPDWTDEEGGGLEGARCRKFPMHRDEDGLVRDDTWFQDAENALPVCNGDYIGTPCPVRRSCLHMALINNDHHGVWGGMTGPQRRWIRRNIPRDRWTDDTFLRDTVPPPEYFVNLGDEDPDADEAAFVAEQEDLRALIKDS